MKIQFPIVLPFKSPLNNFFHRFVKNISLFVNNQFVAWRICSWRFEKEIKMKTRTIRCFPSEEGEIIERMHLLGYNLKHRNEIDNVREVYDGTVSVTRGNYTGGTVYTHEEREHYLSLLFEKDIIDPELDDKLADLEKSVDNTVRILDNAYDKKWRSKEALANANKKFKIGIISASVSVVILLGMLIDAIVSNPYMFIGLIIPAIGSISIGIILFLNIKKRKTLPGEIESQTQIIDQKQEELDDLLRQAKQYAPAIRENYKQLS